MIYDVLELLMNYLQYLYLLVGIAPSVFPTLYRSPFWLVDIVLRGVFSSGSDGNADSHSEAALQAESLAGEEGGALGLRVPSWLPTDLRLTFALTNVVAPLLLVFLSTLLLGPPHCTAFAYLLSASVFLTVAGALLLLFLQRQPPATDEAWQSGPTLAALARGVSTQGAVIITAVGAAAVAVLLVLGIVLRLVLGARERARVLERLRQFESAPDAAEELVARRLLYADDAGPGNGEEMEKEAWVQRAKAEMAHQRLLWRRHKGTRAFSLPWTLLKLLVSLGGFAAAFVFALAPGHAVVIAIRVGQVCYPLAAASFLLALLFAVALVLGLTRSGRLRLFAIKLWLRRMLLGVVFLAVSFMYSPILRSTINLFPCQTVACAASDGDGDAFSGSAATACVQGTRRRTIARLSADAGVPCSGVDGFMTAAALLASSAYAVFFLLLYGLVTRRALRALQQYPLPDSATRTSPPSAWTEAQRADIGATFAGDVTATSPVLPPPPPLGSRLRQTARQEDVIYRARVSSSENEAKFLYSPYAYAFRYFKLVVVAQKTATVVVSTLMREGSGVGSPWMGFAACVVIHAGLGVALVVCRPYAQPLEFVLSLALQLMLSVLAAMGLTSALASTAAPLPLWSFVTTCLFLVPCAAMVVGGVLTLRRHPHPTLCGKRDAKRPPCRAGRRFCDGWGLRLSGCCLRGNKGGAGSWYEQFGRSRLQHEIFVPALYFARDTRALAAAAGNDEAKNEEAAAAGRASPLWDPVGTPRTPTNKCSLFLLESQRHATSDGRVRARRQWARLRAAVFAGRFSGLGNQHRRNSAEAPISSWRAAAAAAATSAMTTPFSPIRLPAEPPSHSLAMTTLLASVANETRWETSPYFSTKKKSRPWQEQQGCRELGESPSPLSSSSPPREARRREAFLERVRVFSARQRLLTLHYRQKRHLLLLQRAVDCLINAQVAQTMRYLLLFLGVTTAAAAALCICGMLRVEGNYVPSSLECTTVR
ncbi:uncharacterized protein Tco025E_04587 [Trypanosoma conorhini]|uniref:Uncharacterized protein n=1 Tax=Trypanosoma conorhini TaxID=83891 RepID=A0A422PKE2_9TRYP|nr:uncharacterized protein Tco025E_04587 [Trypanosoma conorhini]RNF18202.1 hypothetical protein Tco025E_04587 [Trypanosoma conorhini]